MYCVVKIWQLIDLPFHIHLRHFTVYIQCTKGEDLSTLPKVRDKICVPLSQSSSPVLKSQGYLSCIPVTGHNLTLKNGAWYRNAARELGRKQYINSQYRIIERGKRQGCYAGQC